MKTGGVTGAAAAAALGGLFITEVTTEAQAAEAPLEEPQAEEEEGTAVDAPTWGGAAWNTEGTPADRFGGWCAE